MTLSIPRPVAGEYPPYAITYVDATAAALATRSSTDVLALLDAQGDHWRQLLAPLPPTMATHAYAPGKWTLVESLVHIADTERVFAYRLLRVARGDETPLPGFDQDAWVPESRANARSLADALDEVLAVRLATLALVRSLDDTALTRVGMASNHPISARALIWMIAGHMAHHESLTVTRYLA